MAITREAGAARRAWPDTTSGVHVLGGQLSQDLTAVQLAFVATHDAGEQKITRSEAAGTAP